MFIINSLIEFGLVAGRLQIYGIERIIAFIKTSCSKLVNSKFNSGTGIEIFIRTYKMNDQET